MNIESDYKKWLMFNPVLNDSKNLYELYTSVESNLNKGNVSISEENNGGEKKYILQQAGYHSVLALLGGEGRKNFLEYLDQHYLPDQGIEEWYQEKTRKIDKAKNHLLPLADPLLIRDQAPSAIKMHPKESIYFRVRASISICFYMFLIVLFAHSLISYDITGMAIAIIMIAVIPVYLTLKRITQGFFIGIMKGYSVKLNKNQYPEIYKIVIDQADLLGLPEVPEIYVTNGHFNAFVTKMARKKYLMLFSQVIETAANGDFEIVKFIVGHELGHLKRKHLSQNIWLAPSSLIPFLRLAHSRACEFTCDRIGYSFSKQGSIEGILILATGKEIHSKINVQQYIEDTRSEKSFWVWLSEKFLSHPFVSKRLSELNEYNNRGY